MDLDKCIFCGGKLHSPAYSKLFRLQSALPQLKVGQVCCSCWHKHKLTSISPQPFQLPSLMDIIAISRQIREQAQKTRHPVVKQRLLKAAEEAWRVGCRGVGFLQDVENYFLSHPRSQFCVYSLGLRRYRFRGKRNSREDWVLFIYRDGSVNWSSRMTWGDYNAI